MKRNLMVIIIALCLIIFTCAGAEGLLPSLVDTIGKAMPSLGEALGRYPDEEIPDADGGSIEVFQGIIETDFNNFSVYLNEKGAELADYRTDGTIFSASIMMDGKIMSFTYDTQALEASVTYPKGTYDEWLDYAKTQYESTVQLLDEGKTEEALSVLITIPNYAGYKSVAKYFESHPDLAVAAREAKIAPYRNVGGYVTFGTYPQTSSGTDKTSIEWLVLDYDENNHRALLISRYGLDAQRYHWTEKPHNARMVRITWEECELRSWLNDTFLDKAFTAQEKESIEMTDVDNSKNQGYSSWSTSGGNNTQDKIFLLSYAEANQYFELKGAGINMKPRISPTDYAVQAGASESDNDMTEDGDAAGWWWLRSPGEEQYSAALVNRYGFLGSTDFLDVDNICVRPALWINLDSDNF